MGNSPPSDVGLPADLAGIFQTLRTGSVRDRQAAAENLARTGPVARRAIPDLIQLLGHPDPFARLAAGEILAFLGTSAVPALIECAREGDLRSREGACTTLGLMGRDALRALPALMELADDKEVSPWAVRALEAIAPHQRRWRIPGAALFTLVGMTALALTGLLWVIGLIAGTWGGGEALCAYAAALLGGFFGAILGGTRWGENGAAICAIVLGFGGALAGLSLGGILLQLIQPAIDALGH
jgi:hypothetical protein